MPVFDKRFKRKLSGAEAVERYIMILKEDLHFFPKPGVLFKLKIAGKYHESQVKAVDCWCRGPRKPHVHYRIDLAPFAPNFLPHYGQQVTIDKVKEGYYKLA